MSGVSLRELSRLIFFGRIPPVVSLLPHLQMLKIEGNKLKHIRADIVGTGTQRILKFLRERLSEEDLVAIAQDPGNIPTDSCVFPDR